MGLDTLEHPPCTHPAPLNTHPAPTLHPPSCQRMGHTQPMGLDTPEDPLHPPCTHPAPPELPKNRAHPCHGGPGDTGMSKSSSPDPKNHQSPCSWCRRGWELCRLPGLGSLQPGKHQGSAQAGAALGWGHQTGHGSELHCLQQGLGAPRESSARSKALESLTLL